MNKKDFNKALTQVITNLSKNHQWYDTCVFDSTYELLSRIFDNYFDIVEGSCCSHDKAVFTAKRILQSVKDKKTLPLQMTYGKSDYADRFQDCLDEVCYWCPKTIKDTEEAYNIFYQLINPNWSNELIRKKILEITHNHEIPSMDELLKHKNESNLSIFRLVMDDGAFITLLINQTTPLEKGSYLIEVYYNDKKIYGTNLPEWYKYAVENMRQYILYNNLNVIKTEYDS